ncbi:MAG: efflux RND transporter periplasmic adaptor subunit [Gammaproteobacteria bacterium]|nr:efflux RND transporter periplasmic adaptor subunit [Gammaproteobacteria bacterium]MDH3560448.1 efflux RND transporter periplasmic adaptor subunit [Gammaproteobacteria bacterium]
MNHILVAIIAGAILAGGLSTQASADEASSDPGPEIITVKIGDVGGVITLGGTVIPRKTVNLSAQMPGDVEFIAGEEGDAFSKSTVLIQLDQSALLAKRKQAEAQLASAEAAHHNAYVQYNREIVSPNAQSNSMMGGMPSMFSAFTDPMRSMTGKGEPGFDRHAGLVGQGTQLQTAANSVLQAREAIRELDESIENTFSRAPFDGVIISKMIEVGDIVQPGMPLLTFADTTLMQIQVEVPTRLLDAVQEGKTLMARVGNERSVIQVNVDQVFPMAQKGGHTTTVKFGIPEGIKAKTGTYAEVLIPDLARAGQELPMVPASAVVWRGSLPAVFQVTEDDRLKMKVLRLGTQSSDGQISVISGIQPGDRILKEPTPSTTSGPMN